MINSQPHHPCPSDEFIRRVYADLAIVLSDSERDSEGRQAVATETIAERLKSSGHTAASIEWAFHLGCERELLLQIGVKQTKQKSLGRHAVEAKPSTLEVSAITATDEFWKLWKAGQFAPRHKEVIVLVHGIRTFAGWQPMVRRVLEEIPNTHVIPIKFGFFDLFRFWCPLFTRQASLNDLRQQIQFAKRADPDAQLSVIAHSFGTYAISQILRENPDLILHRAIFCGAIVPRSYAWHHVSSQLPTGVLNDYGTRDIMPVLAKSLSWGYGDTGRHGFGRGAAVIDRGHDYSHSDFFNEAFVRTYWKPWFENGQIVPSPWEEKAPPPSWFLSVMSVLPLQWFFCVILIVALVWFGKAAVQTQGRIQAPERSRKELPPTASTVVEDSPTNEVREIADDQILPEIVPPPFNFPSPEIAGVKPLTDEERSQNSFADTKVVIRNETTKTLAVGFVYRPYQAQNPAIAASPYVQRNSPEILPGITVERRFSNFGGSVQISIFAERKWTETNEWFDLRVVPLRTLVVTEKDGTFNCRVEFEEDLE